MAKPFLSVIAAVARNGVIGKDNGLAWRLPADLAHFKRTTLSYPVIMGRKTFESIGRALPGRRNIVVTRNTEWSSVGVESAASLNAALDAVAGAPKVFVIGGAQLYAHALPLADELVLTEIDHDFDGDARFPAWTRHDFEEVDRESHASPEGWNYSFVIYRRRT